MINKIQESDKHKYLTISKISRTHGSDSDIFTNCEYPINEILIYAYTNFGCQLSNYYISILIV